MKEVNYSYVKNFPEFNEIIENNGEFLKFSRDPCTDGVIGARDHIKNRFKQDKCHAALSFANIIKNNYISESTEERCFYLYYWLYNEFKDNNISEYTNEIYPLLFSIVSSNPNNSLCPYYKGSFTIPYNELTKLDDLYNIHNKLYCIKKSCPSCNNTCKCITECSDIYERHSETCKSNNTSQFCTALENIKNIYYNELQNTTDKCGKAKCKILPCDYIKNIELRSSRISTPKDAIISTIFVLLIPALLFIIYKFLPYNSYIHGGIKRIINKWRVMNEERDKSKKSELSKNNCWNSSYNMLYRTI
ncbi:variable surface protein [Plasmodium gonderi]|uniref:Variable surface protein n=1 Tax=Plasmodium gonderi TaxID=77519 RepID=A0A1Y1JPD3_PLAGO|nr:variable surface protein [Plasmodium gonderi]GAW84456.1 variable surface protein [Plasmodium gonderi]